MADLSFKPDPEPPAPSKPDRPPAPAWLTGCKSGLLTVLSFFFLLAMTLVMCAGFFTTHHRLGEMEHKIDELQKDVKGLKADKPDDKKLMPPAN